jgi:hypothetical protein
MTSCEMRFSLSSVSLAASSLLLSASTAASALAGAVSTAAVPLTQADSSGSAIVHAYFGLLSETGSPTNETKITPAELQKGIEIIKPFLDPAFQLQRADGSRYSAQNFIPVDIDNFNIVNVTTTKPRRDVIVVRYAVSASGSVDPSVGMLLSDKLAPRLSVWRWSDGLRRWLLVSHANFNTPMKAICNSKPISIVNFPDVTSASDLGLGKQLASKWFDLLIAGDGSSLMHPLMQSQTASGEGYTTIKQYRPGALKSAELSDYEVTRSGDLLVVSLSVKALGTQFQGQTLLSDQKTPRLLTFLKTEKGVWRLIGSATFNPPVRIDKNIPCISG